MKKLTLLCVASGLSLGLGLQGCSNDTEEKTASTTAVEQANKQTGKQEEKAVQHMEIAAVTSAAEAKKIFIEKTQEIRSKQKLNAAELQDIHFITYTLEQSVAYYAKNLSGERQALAKEIAVVVEDLHIASENNRQASAKQHLAKYFQLADDFMAGM